MAEKKKTSTKREKCTDANKVLDRLKECEENTRIKVKELTEKVLPMYAQMEDLTKKVMSFDRQVESNQNIFNRIKQRLGL